MALHDWSCINFHFISNKGTAWKHLKLIKRVELSVSCLKHFISQLWDSVVLFWCLKSIRTKSYNLYMWISKEQECWVAQWKWYINIWISMEQCSLVIGSMMSTETLWFSQKRPLKSLLEFPSSLEHSLNFTLSSFLHQALPFKLTH